MILALDTSTAACTAALFTAEGALVDSRDEIIGRGHAERLVPMIAELLDGQRATLVLVGIGPGSFTGLRVGIAAAHGLAIGWDAEIYGMSSLALLAAGTEGEGPLGVAITGGHGELFVSEFSRPALGVTQPMSNLAPADAAGLIKSETVIGSGAAALVEARGSGKIINQLPSASHALSLPVSLRSFPPEPLYGRAPDARPKAAA